MRENFIFPDYEGDCLSNVPRLAQSLLGIPAEENPLAKLIPADLAGRPAPKVILVLVDGLGWKQFQASALTHQFFQNLMAKGGARPLTSVFPSTTAAALSTLHTGLTPQEHGLLEWRVYYDELDQVVITLPFTTSDKEGPDSLLKKGVDPKLLIEAPTIYQKLKTQGIPSFVFASKVTAHGAYSGRVHAGATSIVHTNLSDLLVNLREKLAAVSGPAYFFVYWELFDSIAHHYGPGSRQAEAELASLALLWQKIFVEAVEPAAARDTILLLTADHGLIDFDPATTVYLTDYPEIMELLAISPAGKRIMPWGSPRDVFLRAREGQITELRTKLEALLGERAVVVPTGELQQEGRFGLGAPHPAWLRRLGDLVILARDHQVVWYEVAPGERVFKRGMHGGLHPEEMQIPLAITRLTDLPE
ncbi:MAG: alkaline phosphatase family protein [Candidatus Magasanikbacteria bacterium]|nr:alkaline phosphatase family protein [Candidatus Magasanikbacteria bacterium]